MRRLYGWEPRTVTTVERDQDGRVSRTVAVREVEWDDEQRAWMLALAEVEAQECPGCGGHLPGTTRPGVEFDTTHPTRCKRCEALGIRAKNVQQYEHSESFRLWPVTEREPPEV